MKKWLCALVLVFAPAVMAQRGGTTGPFQNIMNLCTSTSGACSYQGQFCADNSSKAVYWCNTITRRWEAVALGAASDTPSSGECAKWDATASRVYWAACGSTTIGIDDLTDVAITSAATGSVLVKSASDWVDGKLDVGDTDAITGTLAAAQFPALSGDVTTSSGSLATTIAANSVALGTDTTGDYVSSATANQGLLLTGTEGASLGLVACAANQILKKNSGNSAWECASNVEYYSFPAGTCPQEYPWSNWHSATVGGSGDNGPGMVCIGSGTGVTSHFIGALSYVDGVEENCASTYFNLPVTWTGVIDATIKWASATADGTKAVVWKVYTACVADGEDIQTPTYHAAQTLSADTNKATAYLLNTVSQSALTVTNCSASEEFFVRICRDPAESGDTLEATAYLIELVLAVGVTH